MSAMPGKVLRIGSLLCAGIAMIPAAIAHAAESGYPTRPIRFIVGFAPGGVADVMARGIGSRVAESVGQQVVVDNRAGGGGVISMQLVAQAPRDGYTILMGSSTQFSINPALRPNIPYDPIRDYTPVSRVAMTPVMLTVQPSFPAKSIQELIDLAKGKAGGTMSYGSTGYGGAPHISAELLKKVAGIPMTHVPFKGGSEAVTALLGGHIQLSFGAVSTSLGQLKAGKLRALGVTSAKRLSAIPDVPTFIESGLAGFEVEQWYGVFMPAGVPVPVVRRMNQELVRALEAPQLRTQFAGVGVELVSSTPEALAAYVKSELARWTKVLQEVGVQEAP